MVKKVTKFLKRLCLLNFMAAIFACLCCSNAFAAKKIVFTIVGDTASGKSIITGLLNDRRACGTSGASVDSRYSVIMRFGGTDDSEPFHGVIYDCAGAHEEVKGDPDLVPPGLSERVSHYADETDIYLVVLDVMLGNESWHHISRRMGNWFEVIRRAHMASSVSARRLNVVFVFNKIDGIDHDDPLFLARRGEVAKFFKHFKDQCEMFSVGKDVPRLVVPVFGSAAPDVEGDRVDVFTLDGDPQNRCGFKELLCRLLPQFFDSLDFFPDFDGSVRMLHCCGCNKVKPETAFSDGYRDSSKPYCKDCCEGGGRCVVM